MQYTLRSATINDLHFLDRIHSKNMQGYVEQIYSWNSTLFKDNFAAQDYQVIEHQNQIIGLVKVVRSKTELYLAEIQISHEYQNKGIGTNIICQITEQAKLNKQRLWLKVIKSNPAINLYQRLGFQICQTSSTHLIMEIDF